MDIFPLKAHCGKTKDKSYRTAMDDSESQFPIGSIVLYKPKEPAIDNARYIGKKALLTRYLRSKTRYTPPLLRDCLIRFASGVTLLVPENDIVLSE